MKQTGMSFRLQKANDLYKPTALLWYMAFLWIPIIILLMGCDRQTSPSKVQPPVIENGLASDQTIAFDADSEIKMSTLKGLICFNCHNILTTDSNPKGISFSHKNHLKRGYHCQKCHGGLGHQGHISPKMAACMECHNGKIASGRCVLCHIKTAEMIPKSHNANWRMAHGEAVKKDNKCADCHKNRFCFSCHQIDMPHPGKWEEKFHGAKAKKDPLVCGSCHPERMCMDCHGVQIPHPANYVKAHKVSQDEKKACFKCHTESSCNSCHEKKNPHSADWATDHKKPARNNWKSCMTCHKNTYCQECHDNDIPHPTDWGDWHKKSAKKDPDSCVTCHKRKFCFNCHEIEMPHPTDWANNHKKPATKEKDICNNCHKPKYCAECH